MAKKQVQFCLQTTRINAGITQAEMAAALGFSTPQFISNCERGLCSLAPKHFKKTSKLLNIPVSALIDWRLAHTRRRIEGEVRRSK